MQILSSLLSRDKNWEGWVISQFHISGQISFFRKACMQLSLKENLRTFDSVPYKYMPCIYSGLRNAGGILLSTSKSEGCPNVILEAMSCGCLILSADNDAAREILTDRTGFLYKSGSTAEAVSTIQNMTHLDGNSIFGIREAQRRYICKNHDYGSVSEKYKDLLETLIKEH